MGTRREIKTHWFIADMSGTTKGKTSCGIECWITQQSEYEADTAAGNRLDVTRMFPFQVTCEKCIKAGMPTKSSRSDVKSCTCGSPIGLAGCQAHKFEAAEGYMLTTWIPS